MTNATMQSAGDTDWFKLDLIAGKTYTIKTAGLNELTFYEIFPASVALDRSVTVLSLGLPPAPATITFTADKTGAYEFAAIDISGAIGAYTITAAPVTNTYTLANGVTLGVGATDKATMQSAGDTDWFKISLTAGKTYTFKTTGLNQLAQYNIVPAASAIDFPVAVQSFSVPPSNGTVTFTADTTGVYEFSASDFNGFTGAYTLGDAVVTNTYALANKVALAVGGADKAMMQSKGDADWFKLSLTAGKTYTIKTTGLSEEAFYNLTPLALARDFPVDVQASAVAANGELTFTADTTGVFEFSASDASGFTGAYTVSAAIVTNTYTLAKGVSAGRRRYGQGYDAERWRHRLVPDRPDGGQDLHLPDHWPGFTGAVRYRARGAGRGRAGHRAPARSFQPPTGRSLSRPIRLASTSSRRAISAASRAPTRSATPWSPTPIRSPMASPWRSAEPTRPLCRARVTRTGSRSA